MLTSSVAYCSVRHKLFDVPICPTVGCPTSIEYCRAIVILMERDATSDRWSVGEHVVTPNGFVAEIVSIGEDRALIRYLSVPPGPGETELPFRLLRRATVGDRFLSRIK